MTPVLLDLNDAIVAALRTRLAADLPAVIAEINAAVTDGRTIPDPQQILDYVPHPALLTVHPTIGIADGPSRLPVDAGAFAIAQHELVIYALLAHPEQEALARQLRRYARAIATVLFRNRIVEGGYNILVTRIEPGPTLGAFPPDSDGRGGPDTWHSWTAVHVRVDADED